jgi:hypothetical protein
MNYTRLNKAEREESQKLRSMTATTTKTAVVCIKTFDSLPTLPLCHIKEPSKEEGGVTDNVEMENIKAKRYTAHYHIKSQRY